jgi:hypothetical protein
MPFLIDCAERHGLVSIETKPAAYGEHDWVCDACKRCIPNHHIGVLHCRHCRCDICPDCWTKIVPKNVNAAGYPCFWLFSHSFTMLGCHRANVSNSGLHAMQCGLDFLADGAWPGQCVDCASKQRELQTLTASGSVASPALTQSGVVAPPEPGLRLTVHNMNLRVRATASLESPIVGLLLMGKQFRFTEVAGSWAKLSPVHYVDLSQSVNCNPEDFRPHNPVDEGWCLMQSAQGEVLLADSTYTARPFASGGFGQPSASWLKVPGAPPPPPRVLISADRVTFTVQSEISINEGFFNAFADGSADGAEAQWLSKFTEYLSQNQAQLNQGRSSGPAETLPAVQALYRSSSIPNARPSMRKQLGAVSNGLVGACLTAFTEVNHT